MYYAFWLAILIAGMSPELWSHTITGRRPSPHYHGTPLYPNERPPNPKKYLLSEDHPLQPTLDAIFSDPKVLDNEEMFAARGFTTLFFRTRTSLRIAKHPDLPGYLFKLYLRSEAGKLMPDRQERLIRRAAEAARLAQFIKKKHIRRFTVAQKWLYQVKGQDREPLFVLVVKDMKVVDYSASIMAWKTKITKGHLKELLSILKAGYASTGVYSNIPYTEDGTFSCIDTEFPRRKHNFNSISKQLSVEMGQVWGRYIHTGSSSKLEF